MWTGFPLFPEQASSIAGGVDALYLFLNIVSGFFSILIFVLIFYFAVRYRRRPSNFGPVQVEGHLGIELLWTVIPFGLTIVMFVWGSTLFIRNSRVPDDAQDIYVVGKQWMWKMQHPEGRREINELHVPVGQPVKLTLASQDVIHSFYVPAFRVKQDVVPGRYTTMWFEATKVGEYHLFCAEYCGTDHSRMIGRVVVMEPDDFQRWLGASDQPGTTETVDQTVIQTGERLFREYRCLECHAAGTPYPPLAGKFGTAVPVEGGGQVLFDEDYIRESLINPNTRISAGQRAIMPTYRGQLTEEEILQIILYIRSLEPTEGQIQ